MNQAFHRSIAIFALIAAAQRSENIAAAMAAIPDYESRGKGRGRSFGTSGRPSFAHIKRTAVKAHNRAKHRRAVRANGGRA